MPDAGVSFTPKAGQKSRIVKFLDLSKFSYAKHAIVSIPSLLLIFFNCSKFGERERTNASFFRLINKCFIPVSKALTGDVLSKFCLLIFKAFESSNKSVSYTHLTLPTIYSV